MSLIFKILASLLLLLMLVIGWGWLDYQNSLATPITKETVLFEIKRGDSFNRITDNLISHKIDISPWWFKLYAYQNNYTQQLKAGEYLIKPDLKVNEILSLFVNGKAKQYSITFPEGWTFKQILQKLAQHEKIKPTLNGLSDKAILNKIDNQEKHPEGLFFPDTYHFHKNTTDLSLLKRAYIKMQQILKEQWQTKATGLPIKTPYEALILASIVEKETGKPSERQTIAGVFSRRLLKGMKLQTDPTVIYGMGDTYKGDIRFKDLRTPTPYNTYTINGLPPTPIAMPGKEAIYAALHPEAGKSLFFVSRGDGSHVFSESLKAHNNAVNKYQRKSK